jgi:hypothetical protein
MMSDTAHVLEQMRAANPAPSLEQLAVEDLDLVRDRVARRRSTMTTPVREQSQQVHLERPTRRRWMRPVFVAGLAALVVLGTISIALLVFRGGDHGEPAGPVTIPPVSGTQSETTDASSTAAPEIDGPVTASGPEWTLVSIDDAVFGPGAITNVIAVHDGFLAVGVQGERCLDEGFQCRAGIWHSPDGSEWSQVFVDDSSPSELWEHRPSATDALDRDGIGTWFVDAASTSRGYLAVGRYYPYSPFTAEPVVYFSIDGVVWEPVDPEGIELYDGDVEDLTVAGDAFLLCGQADISGAIWRSEDGIVWTKVLEDPIGSIFEAVERVGDRYLAVGGGGGEDVVRIWSSTDGITWVDVSTDPFLFGTARPDSASREYARAVAAVDSGFVIAGQQLDRGEGAIWFSEDGTSWVLVPTDGVFRDAAPLAMAGSADRLVAVGVAASEPPRAVAWSSDDGGMTWKRTPIDPAMTGRDSRFWGVTIHADTAVAGLSVDGRAAIWQLDLDGEE